MITIPSLTYYQARNEQGMVHAASAYAKMKNRLQTFACTSSIGPGATNMVTGIATAMLDSSPIVCITGQVGSKLIGSDAFQETDITGITLPITKHNYLVTRAEAWRPYRAYAAQHIWAEDEATVIFKR